MARKLSASKKTIEKGIEEDPKAMLKHFEEIAKEAKTPEELEKANFWITHYRNLIEKK